MDAAERALLRTGDINQEGGVLVSNSPLPLPRPLYRWTSDMDVWALASAGEEPSGLEASLAELVASG